MESEKIILDIVVDVQKDFITGALANPAAQANVAHLADTAKAHAEAGHWMFFTRDTHPDNYLETRNTWTPARAAACRWSTASRARTAGTLPPSWKTRWPAPNLRSAA